MWTETSDEKKKKKRNSLFTENQLTIRANDYGGTLVNIHI